MEPPKCRICQTCHWSSEPCKFSEESNEDVELPEPNLVRHEVHEQARQTPDVEVSKGTLRKRVWRAKNKTRYNQYQKNWMRKNRGQT